MKKLLALALSLFIATGTEAAAPPAHTSEAGGIIAQTAGSCDFPTLTVAGRLYVIGVYLQTTTGTVSSITDSTGANTYHILGPYTSGSGRVFLAWTVPASGSFEFMSVNFDGTYTGDIECAEYTGMAAAGSVQDCTTGATGNSTALNSGTCVPTAANDLLVGFGGTQTNSVTYTPGTGFTLEMSQPHGSLGDSVGFEDLNSTDCTAQGAAMAGNVSGQWGMAVAAFKTSSPTACSVPPAFTGSVTFR